MHSELACRRIGNVLLGGTSGLQCGVAAAGVAACSQPRRAYIRCWLGLLKCWARLPVECRQCCAAAAPAAHRHTRRSRRTQAFHWSHLVLQNGRAAVLPKALKMHAWFHVLHGKWAQHGTLKTAFTAPLLTSVCSRPGIRHGPHNCPRKRFCAVRSVPLAVLRRRRPPGWALRTHTMPVQPAAQAPDGPLRGCPLPRRRRRRSRCSSQVTKAGPCHFVFQSLA